MRGREKINKIQHTKRENKSFQIKTVKTLFRGQFHPTASYFTARSNYHQQCRDLCKKPRNGYRSIIHCCIMCTTTPPSGRQAAPSSNSLAYQAIISELPRLGSSNLAPMHIYHQAKINRGCSSMLQRPLAACSPITPTWTGYVKWRRRVTRSQGAVLDVKSG